MLIDRTDGLLSVLDGGFYDLDAKPPMTQL